MRHVAEPAVAGAVLFRAGFGANPRPATAAVQHLSLYQKTARASLVIRARSLSSSTRKPRVAVLEVLKGHYEGENLRIVPHYIDYTQPLPGVEREVFTRGEESILFLVPYVDEFGRRGKPDVYAVVGAAQGKVAVPPEGREALIEAIKRFVQIDRLGQMDRQAVALRGLLRLNNPYLIEAGLVQCRKYHLATRDDTEVLLRLMGHRRPDFRSGALALVRQLLLAPPAESSDEVTAGPLDKTLFDQVAGMGRFDENEEVRRQAIRTLAAFGDESALAMIESIGKNDPNQAVRYEAQVAAWRLRNRLH
ncbi:MAG: HEAT repeat domain-containing protein [Acidobacteriota bacterium]